MTAIQGFISSEKLSRAYFPIIMTIDVAQRHEATMTITDCAVQGVEGKSDIGFIAYYGRFNVGVTRAKEVRWAIGGDCEGPFLASTAKKGLGAAPMPVQYLNNCIANDQQTTTDYGPIPEDLVPKILSDAEAEYGHFFRDGVEREVTGKKVAKRKVEISKVLRRQFPRKVMAATRGVKRRARCENEPTLPDSFYACPVLQA